MGAFVSATCIACCSSRWSRAALRRGRAGRGPRGGGGRQHDPGRCELGEAAEGCERRRRAARTPSGVAEYLAALDAALPPSPDEPEQAQPAHVSPTDPQAAFTRKGGFWPLRYAINPLLDLDTDCVVDVEATPARFSAEVVATRTLVSRVKAKLGVAPVTLAADKAYGSGPLLGWLIDQGVTPHVPVIDRTRQRDDFFTRDAFRYDREADAYRFRSTSRSPIGVWRAPARSASIAANQPTAPDARSPALKPTPGRDSDESASSACSGISSAT